MSTLLMHSQIFMMGYLKGEISDLRPDPDAFFDSHGQDYQNFADSNDLDPDDEETKYAYVDRTYQESDFAAQNYENIANNPQALEGDMAAAVPAIRHEIGLSPEGILDIATLQNLELQNRQATEISEPESSPPGIGMSDAELAALQELADTPLPEMQNANVLAAQKLLNTSEGYDLAEDGLYGPKTDEALSEFLDAVPQNRQATEISEPDSSPPGINMSDAELESLQKLADTSPSEMNNTDVLAAQKLLNTSESYALAEDGLYGPNTSAALSEFLNAFPQNRLDATNTANTPLPSQKPAQEPENPGAETSAEESGFSFLGLHFEHAGVDETGTHHYDVGFSDDFNQVADAENAALPAQKPEMNGESEVPLPREKPEQDEDSWITRTGDYEMPGGGTVPEYEINFSKLFNTGTVPEEEKITATQTPKPGIKPDAPQQDNQPTPLPAQKPDIAESFNM